MPVQISRIFHAGYQFESQQTKILFDPLFENPFSQNCFAFPPVQFDHQQIRQSLFSAVFISHYHDDHCSFESLDLLDRATPVYVFCIFEDLFLLLNKLGFKNIFSLKWNQSVFIGPFEIIPLRALDEDTDCLFHIKVDDKNILNVVDSWIDEEILMQLSRTSRWDLVLWPFQLLQELQVLSPGRLKFEKKVSLPVEWVEQIKSLNPKVIVPSSCHFKFEQWSWYNDVYFPISYRQFEKEIKNIKDTIEVARLNPGEALELNQKGVVKTTPLPWVLPQGDQDLDYFYQPETKPSTTAEIAQKFPGLTKQQTARVINYCRSELVEIFKLLDHTKEVYFDKSRVWKLSLFDSNGTKISFYYQIRKSEILALESGFGSVSWCTEIPLQKLYAALENGESLSSIYLRINDVVFDPEIEKELVSVDLLADPLLRCLYSGKFGSYQRSQLLRLGYE